MTTNTYWVTGLTCGHCVTAITQELTAIDSVTEVTVELVKGGASAVTVTSAAQLSQEGVRAAVDEAGYELVEG